MLGPIAHINLSRSYRGGERQTELLIRGLAERGYAQRLIARAGAPLADRLSDIVPTRAVSGLIAAARACGRESTLVHVHEGRAPIAACLAQLCYDKPYIITRRVPRRLKRNPVTRQVYRRASRVVAISKAVAAELATYDPRLQVDIIPSALAHLKSRPETVAALRDRYAGRFVIGLVGALVTRHKGQDILIEVARRVAREHSDLQFVLVGDGEDEPAIRAQSRGLVNVELTGFVEDVGSYLEAFDLVTLPSREEGLGSVLLDAMDHGKPIVGARVGGIPELVIEGENGLLVTPGSVDELERAILTLHEDPVRLAAMGERSRARAGLYTPARMVERYIELYRSVQEESRA
jgi:glycosyltransferase involved in cell wall biosynthesis